MASPRIRRDSADFLEGPADSRTYSQLVLFCSWRRFAIEIIPECEGQVEVVLQFDRE